MEPIPKPKHKRIKRTQEFNDKALDYCQHCGKTDAPISRHHIIKRSHFGGNDPENQIDLCSVFADTCHIKADQGWEGYTVEDLRRSKARDEKRREGIAKLLSPPTKG